MYSTTHLVLDRLSHKYQLGIIANQSDYLVERLKSLGILKYFLFIVSSYDYNIAKRDIKLFQFALKQLKYKASDTVMTGDRLDNDKFYTKQLGMKTIWIKHGFGEMQTPKTIKYTPDLTISKLAENC